MKKTVEKIVTVYRILNSAKISKMEDSEKFAFIKAVHQMKKVSADFEDALKDAQEKLKPEGFDEIVNKPHSKEDLNAEETAILEKYNEDVTNCVNDELKKEVELNFSALSEGAIGRLISSNDLTINEILTIIDIIGD